MKKIIFLILILSMAISSFSQSIVSNLADKKILIAYFTWADNTIPPSSVDGIASPSVLIPGNVAIMAENIQKITGGDLFSIKVSNPYPNNFEECLKRVHIEQDNNFYPQLKEKAGNINDYDVIFLGYPNWGYTAPQALFSFIKEQNIHNKTIIPFCSHGTGGIAGSIEDIKLLLPDCEILPALGINRNEIKNSYSIIKNWLENN